MSETIIIDDALFYAPEQITSLEINGYQFSGTYQGVTSQATYGDKNVIIDDEDWSHHDVKSSAIVAVKGGTIYRKSTYSGTGAIFNINSSAATVVIADTDFRVCSASKYGGAIYNTGTLSISGSTFTGCFTNHTGDVYGGGGAIDTNSTSGKTVIADTEFYNNSAAEYGGALFIAGTATIGGLYFSGNSAGIAGGAIFNKAKLTVNGLLTLETANDTIYNSGTMTIDTSSFLINGATAAKVVDAKFDSSWLTCGDISASQTGSVVASSGAWFMYENDMYVTTTAVVSDAGNIYVAGSYFGNAETDLTAALASYNAVALTQYEVTDRVNVGENDIYFGNKTVFTGNTNSSLGAALYADKNAAVVDGATFCGNLSTSSDANFSDWRGGGAVYSNVSSYTSTIDNSLLQGNTAYGNGGGIFVNNRGNLTGNMFVDNTAGHWGGGLFVAGSGVVSAGDLTFDGNQALSGGAVYNKGTLTINGLITLKQATDTIYNAKTITVDGDSFFANDETGMVKVIDANTADWFSGNAISATSGYALIDSDNDLYIARETDMSGIVSADGSVVVANGYFGEGYTSIAAALEKYTTVALAEYSAAERLVTFTDSIKIIGDGKSALTGQSSSSNGGAINFSLDNETLTLNKVNFTDNTTTGNFGGAINLGKGRAIITDAVFSGNKENGAQNWGGGGAVFQANSNEMLTIADSVFMESSAHMGGAVGINSNVSITDSSFANNSAVARGGAIYLNNTAQLQLENVSFISNSVTGDGGAVFVGGTAGLSGMTMANAYFAGNEATENGGALYTAAGTEVFMSGATFATASDSIYNLGTVNFAGNISLKASLTGDGIWNIADDTNFTLGAGIDLNGLDFSNADIIVDGSLFTGEATTIATDIGGLGDYTIKNTTPFLELAVVDNNLVLKEVEAVISGETEVASLTGNGVNVISGGKITSVFFAEKTNSADVIATKASAGEISNLIGGAYATNGTATTVNKVELDITGDAEITDRVYAGGYLYGVKDAGAAAAAAQMTVDEVNITIDGGAVSNNMFGGAHAREYGNAKVDTVNITVTKGNHSRIYAGGWAEKGAESHVGTANVTISGGTVDYLYGGGANADGKTYVGTSNITISGDAVVNTIFMGGRYGYSYVDTVNLTFADDAKELKRLSGVSSAGMDYADATVVELETNVTADLIDYVDKFVINEGCMLTANDDFYLGNRVEGGAEPGVTTFDFIADGEANWTAVAGIDDFTNAKFAVNGSEAQLWDGKSAIAIGGYELTYDVKDKTIKLAQITA